ncbi:MAG: DNA mismatch repair endonuclease MutL [Myxococcota bacterium]
MPDQLISVIHVLPSDVVNRIAAGEVIERPASVVKELVENALDAGAKAVTVDIEGGGLERITVSDDGSGMSPDDAQRCIVRHATSKLRAAGDLFTIRTLGFRGEALSSIAAISRLTLTSRRPTDDEGIRVRLEGGNVTGVEAVGCPTGTTVDVRDLFFNTPARRKFMRSPATEQSHVVDAGLRTILGARRGGMVLQAGSRRLIDVPEDVDEQGRVLAALGRRVAPIFPFDVTRDGLRVSGFVTRPEVDRANARGLSFFVNGRFVRDRMLQRAALDGYRSMLERGRYPVAVVYVDVDPAEVDVNVHPQKLEVRFSDGNAVFRTVASAVTGVLASTPWLEGSSTEQTVAAIRKFWRAPGPGVRAAEGRHATYVATPHPVAEVLPLPGVETRGYFSSLRPVGQVLGVYLVCQGDDELVLIDQHAAHERVAYENLQRQAAAAAIERQQLLFPEVVEVAPRLLALLEENWESLVEYGFEVEPTGPCRFAVKAIPAALGGADAKRLVEDLLDELDAIGSGAPAATVRRRILSRCACHVSVRAGDALGSDEITELLRELDRVDFGANCPHGRPVSKRWARAELDGLFHR